MTTRRHLLSTAIVLLILTQYTASSILINENFSAEDPQATSSARILKDDSDSIEKKQAKNSDDLDDDAPISGHNEANIVFNSTYFDSPILDVIFCIDTTSDVSGPAKETLLALSSDGYVYLSELHGLRWINLTQEGLMPLSSSKGKDTKITQFLQHQIDTKVVLFIGVDQHYVTDDCGQTIRPFSTSISFHSFQFHPVIRDYILGAAWSDCEEDEDPDTCSRYKKLYVSKDLGDSWNFIGSYVIGFSWAIQNIFQAFSIPQERIIVSHITKKEGHQSSDKWIEEAEIAYSDDYFKNKTVLVPGGNKFLISEHFLFAIEVRDAAKEEIRFLVADAMVPNYKFAPIELSSNIKNLKEHSYTLLEYGKDRVFLHINHEGPASKYGTLYLSDSTGLRYTDSLHYQIGTPFGKADFTKVEGLPGIYITNVYDEKAVKLSKIDRSDGQIPAEQPGGKSSGKFKAASSDSQAQERRESLDNHVITMISFNRGGTWQRLQAPAKDADGEPIYCEEECNLHLTSYSSINSGPPYSSKHSLGIVLGVGNVGEYLSTRPDELNTYFSRDGGLTWYEIMKGPHTFEIGDHGALIVVAPTAKATKHVYYTWNEGLTWEKLQISKTPIEISNILIEPNNTSQQFLILGRTAMSGSKRRIQSNRGIITTVDFSQMHERPCVGFKEATTDPTGTDYEKFTPNGKISPDCLLGVKTTYIRRKREAECFNPETQLLITYENCECTEDDWECDLGYKRSDSGRCIKTTGQRSAKINIIPQDCKDYYYVSQGYRKIAGDNCVGGVDHSPVKMKCPAKGPIRESLIAVAILFLLSFAWVAFRFRVTDFFFKGGEKKAPSGAKFQQLHQRAGMDEDDDEENKIALDDKVGSDKPKENHGSSQKASQNNQSGSNRSRKAFADEDDDENI